MPHTAEERNVFMNEKNSISSYNGYQPLIGAFGANGSIPGVEAQPLDIPEGLDEKTVAAIVVGASLSPDRLTYPMGDFASGSDVTVSNQSLIMDQVSSGNVTPQTAAILSAGRKDAQAALDAFKAGDDSLVKRHLKTYADHAVRKVGDLMPDSGDLSVSGQSISLINDVLSENKFGITPTGTAIGKERLKIFKKAGDAKIQANAGQQRLINEFDTLSQAEKEQLAAEMIFNGYVGAIPSANQQQLKTQVNEYVTRSLNTVGITPQDEQLYAQIRKDPAIVKIENQLLSRHNYMAINNDEAILAQDNGIDQLKELSMEQIKQSDLFKSIVGSKSKEELVDNLIDAEGQFSKGLGSVEGVAIPTVNEKLNNQFKTSLEDSIHSSMDNIAGAAANNPALSEKTAQYAIEGLGPESFKKAAEQTQKMYDMLAAAAPQGDNETYKELMNYAGVALDRAKRYAGKDFVGKVDASSLSDFYNKINRGINKYILIGAETDPEKLSTLQQANIMAVAGSVSINESVLQRS